MQTMKNGAGEPELEEESSSFAEGAVRCGFKDNCFIVSGLGKSRKGTKD